MIQTLGWSLAILMAVVGLLFTVGFVAGVWWRQEVLRSVRPRKVKWAEVNGEDHAGHP